MEKRKKNEEEMGDSGLTLVLMVLAVKVEMGVGLKEEKRGKGGAFEKKEKG